MTSDTEKIIADRIKQIDSEISQLREEKKKAKQALSLFKGDPDQPEGARSKTRGSGEPTFKEKVCTALSRDYQNGATAHQLLVYLNENWTRHVKRESLSPQLSRLKNDDKVIGYNSDTGKWFLLKNSGPVGPDDEVAPSSSVNQTPSEGLTRTGGVYGTNPLD